MKKFLLILLAFLSCFQVVLAQDQTPDKFTLYTKDPNTINPLKLIYELKPGDETTEQIILKNFSQKDKIFTIYVTDQNPVNKKGLVAYFDENQKRKMAEFMTVEPSTVSVKANSEAPLTVHIKIPQDAQLGEYLGAIAAVNTRPSTNMPNIKIAVRYLFGLDVKITNNPQHVPKFSDRNILPIIYLCSSVILFIACMGYYLHNSKKEKKHHATHHPEHSTKT